MDVTTVLAVLCSAIVFLSWFVLPHGASTPVAHTDREASDTALPEAVALT